MELKQKTAAMRSVYTSGAKVAEEKGGQHREQQ
jgi:hypothetical protein